VSCSNSNDSLDGYIPPSPKNVSTATVHEAGSSTPMTFVPAAGEVLIVYFGYTHCPDLCPTTMVAVKNAKKKIGELAAKVDLAMITVDPARDTDEILSRYLASFSDRYHALVPTSDAELRAVEKHFQATSSVTNVDGEIQVVHGGTAYVVDSTGTVVVEWPFGLDSVSMAHDLTILLTERK
jgi:protein SCO1/2